MTTGFEGVLAMNRLEEEGGGGGGVKVNWDNVITDGHSVPSHLTTRYITFYYRSVFGMYFSSSSSGGKCPIQSEAGQDKTSPE